MINLFLELQEMILSKRKLPLDNLKSIRHYASGRYFGRIEGNSGYHDVADPSDCFIGAQLLDSKGREVTIIDTDINFVGKLNMLRYENGAIRWRKFVDNLYKRVAGELITA